MLWWSRLQLLDWSSKGLNSDVSSQDRCKDNPLLGRAERMPCHDGDSYRGNGVLHILRSFGRPSHHLAGGGEVVEQAAGGAVRGVHRAQEAPGLRQQLAHGGRPQLREVGAPVNGSEVGQVPARMDMPDSSSQRRCALHAKRGLWAVAGAEPSSAATQSERPHAHP